MNNHELTLKAIRWESPEQIPVSIWMLPAAFIRHGKKLNELTVKYKDLVGSHWETYDPHANMPNSYRKGSFTDAWGCVWENYDEGMESIVTGHPIPTREDILTYEVPKGDHGTPHGFMYLRLLDLRGFEEGMIDFFEEPPELQILIDKVLNYNMRQIELMMKNNNSEMIGFGDDLGMQNMLAMGPEKWRKYMKPCYQKMYKPIKDAGKLVYMHTDGCIHEIMKDLQECGVDMINPQFRANGLDNLVRVCKGKIPINLDLDRQLFPFGTPDDMKRHVEECVKALYLPEGGLALNLEIGPDNPLENIEALFEAVNEYKDYR